MIDLTKQVLIIVYSFLSGIIFGIGFDVYKELINKRKNNLINIIKYSIYWIILGVSVFWFLLYTQFAILSFYTYFYILLGIIIYKKFISKSIFLKIVKITNSIFTFLRLLARNILYVLLLIFKKKINKNI